jgi:hypothetical protein
MNNFSLLNLFIIISLLSLFLAKKDKDKKKKDEPDPKTPEFAVGYISLPFTLSENNVPVSQIQIGHPKQDISLVLDVSSMRTWVSDQYFRSDQSDTYVETGELDAHKEYDFSYSGVGATETFKVSDKKLEQFKFVLVNLQNTNFQGVLSLGHEYDSKHKSLVYEMSHVCNTFYNMFMFKFDEKGGELLIGDTTEEQKERNHLINKCRYLVGGDPEEQIKWRCELTQIFIGGIEDFPTFRNELMEQTGYYISKTDFNKLIEVKEPVAFETIFDKIYVPKKTMEYLKANYLKNFANDQKMCNFDESEDKITVKCSKDEISKLKRLNFVLSEKTALALPSSALFECGNSDICEFLIQYNSKFKGFIFGLPIFKLYNIIFDYNSRDLMFYSSDNKYLISIPVDLGTSILIVIIWILVVAILIMLAGLLVIYILRRKNRKRKEIEDQIYENF